MDTAQVARVNELIASQGTNMVIAAVFVLFLMGVLAVVIASMKQQGKERQAMFSHLIGDGNGNKGQFTRMTEALEDGNKRFDQLDGRMDGFCERLNGIEETLQGGKPDLHEATGG